MISFKWLLPVLLLWYCFNKYVLLWLQLFNNTHVVTFDSKIFLVNRLSSVLINYLNYLGIWNELFIFFKKGSQQGTSQSNAGIHLNFLCKSRADIYKCNVSGFRFHSLPVISWCTKQLFMMLDIANCHFLSLHPCGKIRWIQSCLLRCLHLFDFWWQHRCILHCSLNPVRSIPVELKVKMASESCSCWSVWYLTNFFHFWCNFLGEISIVVIKYLLSCY